MISQGRDGISFGVNSPCGFSGNGLVLWHWSQVLMYFPTYAAIPGHQKLLWINSNVLHCPGCPATGVSWHDSTTLWRHISGTYIFPLYRRVSSSPSSHPANFTVFHSDSFVSLQFLHSSSSFWASMIFLTSGGLINAAAALFLVKLQRNKGIRMENSEVCR